MNLPRQARDKRIGNVEKREMCFPAGLHGGPSFTHNYILPLKLLAASGYPIILYDQAGCGLSTNGVTDVTKTAPHLLTIEYVYNTLRRVYIHYCIICSI